MMKSAFRWSSSCLGFGLGLLACKSDPEGVQISSTQAALTASENSERALDGLLDAADFVSESTSVAQTLGALGGGGESCSSTGSACLGTSSSCPEPETVCTSQALDESDLEQSRAELKQNVESLVKDLREAVQHEDEDRMRSLSEELQQAMSQIAQSAYSQQEQPAGASNGTGQDEGVVEGEYTVE